MNTQEVSPGPPLETVELSDYLRVVRERKWTIAASVIIVLVVVIAASLIMTPKYRATAQLLYQKTNLDSALFESSVFEAANKEREVQTAARLVKLEKVAIDAFAALEESEALKTATSPADLLRMVTAEPDGQTDVVRVSAVSTDAQEAADVANAVAVAFVNFKRDTDQRAIRDAREDVERQLNTLDSEASAEPDSASATSPDYSILRKNLENLKILETMQNGGFETEGLEATVPLTAFSPQPLRNGVLALAVGLIVGIGLAFLFEYLDKSIKDEQGLEREFGLPVLASVPAVGGRWRKKRLGKAALEERSNHPIGFPTHNSPLAEPFRTLRSSLQYFNVDRSVRVLLVTSGLPQQGKTVTAINLGLSLALAGERVVIIEADLRRPMIHSYLGLSNEIGVSSVLAGSATFAEAMQLVQLDEFVAQESSRRDPGNLSKNIYCITSGPLPPNPAELAGSHRMQELIDKAAESADYVLVDSPPLLLVADGLSLAKCVDGVIVATVLDETTRDEARQMISMLQRAGANPVGVVAGGVHEKNSVYHKYGYYHQTPVVE